MSQRRCPLRSGHSVVYDPSQAAQSNSGIAWLPPEEVAHAKTTSVLSLQLRRNKAAFVPARTRRTNAAEHVTLLRGRVHTAPPRPIGRGVPAAGYSALGTMSAQRVLPSILAALPHLAVVQTPRLAVLHAHGHLALGRAPLAQVARLGEDGQPRPLPSGPPPWARLRTRRGPSRSA